jgi:hypothetical protein
MITQLVAVADWIAKLEHLQSLRLKSRDEQGKPWILYLQSFKNNVNLTDMYLLGRFSSSSILSQFPKSLVELTPVTFQTRGGPHATFERIIESSDTISARRLLRRTNHVLPISNLSSASCIKILESAAF